ncbi:hypothetical protein [Sphingomonas psychrolutea]|uniref:hypothetical protein n=1 Tax=Sphingomonas psychrolutea TaxID=1259676 RepID=UPI00166968EC|nr:hypothetical protein [Sphingomonas psychrolutea]
MSRTPYDTPIFAAAEHGIVVLDGPDGLATSLTPAAARKSAHHIASAAEIAEKEPDAESPWRSS